MSEDDQIFCTASIEECHVLDSHLRTIWRLERKNYRLRIIMCWAIALTFAVGFALGYLMGARWK